jgi:hypothetical protein
MMKMVMEKCMMQNMVCVTKIHGHKNKNKIKKHGEEGKSVANSNAVCPQRSVSLHDGPLPIEWLS